MRFLSYLIKEILLILYELLEPGDKGFLYNMVLASPPFDRSQLHLLKIG